MVLQKTLREVKVLEKMKLSVAARKSFSHGYLYSSIFSITGYRAKLKEPALKVAISGFSSLTTAILSSGVIVAVPPVVGLTTTLLLALMPLRISRYVSTSVVGLPLS